MSVHFEVQARRRHGVPVRDEVRLARTDTVDDALSAAHALTADGFTAWVFRVETGSAPRYRTVCRLAPHEPPS